MRLLQGIPQGSSALSQVDLNSHLGLFILSAM